MEAVVVLAEILRELSAVPDAWAELPPLGKVRRVLTRESNSSYGSDDPEPHEFRPVQIYGCACELRASGQHARELIAWVGASLSQARP